MSTSSRNKVLEAAGAVVAVWSRTFKFIPEELEDAVIDLKNAIEHMNATAHARNSDPDTSRQGPDTSRMTKQRLEVLLLLRQRPRTDEELVSALAGVMSASGARTRRAELVRQGLARDSGERRRNATGRKVKVWCAT
jgi:hypothetical protein